MAITRIRINSKRAFNDRLYDNFPELSKICHRFNAYLSNDIELPELARLVHFRSDITAEGLNASYDIDYFQFLNDLYNHIEKNEDMIDFWLL